MRNLWAPFAIVSLEIHADVIAGKQIIQIFELNIFDFWIKEKVNPTCISHVLHW